MSGARVWLALPAAILILVVALLVWWRPLDRLAAGAPPVEEAAVESVRLTPGMISISLRTDGSEPVVVAQIQVDGAYRSFTTEPGLPAARLGLTRFDIPYPWIAGEAHHVLGPDVGNDERHPGRPPGNGFTREEEVAARTDAPARPEPEAGDPEEIDHHQREVESGQLDRGHDGANDTPSPIAR